MISSQIYIMDTKNQTNLSQLVIGKYEDKKQNKNKNKNKQTKQKNA